ncbi:hypothetical protein [Pseudidiomarina terrestris]|uniref:hypothetical protein n=1 Tax=Pseudidiomarina terrestris TaxID=2820060 RepID=UPI002651ACE4|nr:hypothetical protein [Pseudidiomarina sp. 1ASP75-5]MDN7134976.1 hypothetical protein [Pseudidiomarina sp. 1ASP75-5]
MTQFCMVKSDECPSEMHGVVFNKIEQDVFSKAKKQIAKGSQVWNIFYKGKNVDTLCCEAQKQLNGNHEFQETELYGLVTKLASMNLEYWFWYGDDFLDLEDFSSIGLLLKEIERSVVEPQCEVYFHWVPPSKLS